VSPELNLTRRETGLVQSNKFLVSKNLILYLRCPMPNRKRRKPGPVGYLSMQVHPNTIQAIDEEAEAVAKADPHARRPPSRSAMIRTLILEALSFRAAQRRTA
jgi:hypothetical protein